jgi:dipeptidyl aminopeptidase/acylaminoacyl peptidase
MATSLSASESPAFADVLSLRSVTGVRLSPDGARVLFGVQSADWKENAYDTELWLVGEEGEPFQLTRTAKGSSRSGKWSPDGRWVAFLADRGDKAQIHLIRAFGGEAQSITAVKQGISSFEWAPDGRHIAFLARDEAPDQEERKKRYGAFAVEDQEHVSSHLWRVAVQPDPWPGPSERPCLEHEGDDDDGDSDEGDMWDVMSGVDHLIAEGIVDETRMGAMGWSQGGYISAFLATNTDRFKAISVGAGISNWMTYYVSTDIHPFTRQYLKGTPWSDPDIYDLTSPMTNINQAKTPTLIQHGELDRRVPTPNAYELYQGLQDVGVDTRLIIYKDLGHGISKPKERLAAVWHNWQWFARHNWDEEVELPGAVAND